MGVIRQKKTIGVQYIDAADSISANIPKDSEGITKKIKLNLIDIVKARQRNVTIEQPNQKVET